jgi:hypothetical protein
VLATVLSRAGDHGDALSMLELCRLAGVSVRVVLIA